MWGGYNDGSNFYLNVRLKCEGENVARVDFYADEGFFAKQYLKMKDGKVVVEEGVPATYVRNEVGGLTLVTYGEEFEIIGNAFTLAGDAMTDDLLLFLGIESADVRQFPSRMTVRAVATFDDGETQEETLVFDLSGRSGAVTWKLSPEESAQMQADYARYEAVLRDIPLDLCEVAADSLKTLTYGDTYAYQLGGADAGTGYFPITEDAMDAAVAEGRFDEDGIFRIGSNLYDYDARDAYDGSDGYIAALKRNEDGTFTGMVYRVPGRLISEAVK
jgi:hypothetical protein